ncbi:hypothetical protein GCM10027174_32820 [Salinifilum aidingensis]
MQGQTLIGSAAVASLIAALLPSSYVWLSILCLVAAGGLLVAGVVRYVRSR